MKVMFYAAIAMSLASVASAQDAQITQKPQFSPWEVDEQTSQTIMNALGEIPLKYALPIYQYIVRKEDLALLSARAKSQQDAAKMNGGKTTPEPSPSPAK